MVLPLLGSDDGVDVDVDVGVDVIVGVDVLVGADVLVGDEVEYPVVNCNKNNYMQCEVQHRYSFVLYYVSYTG